MPISSSTRIAPSWTACTCSPVRGSVGASPLTGISQGSWRTAGPAPRRLALRPPPRRDRRRVSPCTGSMAPLLPPLSGPRARTRTLHGGQVSIIGEFSAGWPIRRRGLPASCRHAPSAARNSESRMRETVRGCAQWSPACPAFPARPDAEPVAGRSGSVGAFLLQRIFFIFARMGEDARNHTTRTIIRAIPGICDTTAAAATGRRRIPCRRNSAPLCACRRSSWR